MTTTKTTRSNPEIKRLLAATYPEWKGRKIRIVTATDYQLSDYWTEGSRNFVKAYDLATGAVAYPKAASGNPFRPEGHARIEIPSGVALVEHSIFCGKDGGVTIYVRDAARLGTP